MPLAKQGIGSGIRPTPRRLSESKLECPDRYLQLDSRASACEILVAAGGIWNSTPELRPAASAIAIGTGGPACQHRTSSARELRLHQSRGTTTSWLRSGLLEV